MLTAICAVCLITLASPAQAGSYHIASPAQQYPGRVGFYKTGSMSKASSSLAIAFAEYRTHVGRGTGKVFKPSNEFLRLSQGRVVVDASATGSGGVLLSDLKRLGLKNGKRYGNKIGRAHV